METKMLNELSWQEQLREVIKQYHKGIITYAEYITKQTEIIHHTLWKGIPWSEINEFAA